MAKLAPSGFLHGVPSFFLIPCLIIIGSVSAPRTLNYTKQVEAIEGKSIEFHYQSEIPIDSCEFDFNDGKKRFEAYEGMTVEGVKFVGNYTAGKCAVRLFAMKQELAGELKVEITFPNENDAAWGISTLAMLRPSADNKGNIDQKDKSSIYTTSVVIGPWILLVIGCCVVYICILKALSAYIARRSVSRDAPVPSNRRAGCNAVKKAAKKEDGAHPLLPDCCITVPEESSEEDEKSSRHKIELSVENRKKIVKVEHKNPTNQ